MKHRHQHQDEQHEQHAYAHDSLDPHKSTELAVDSHNDKQPTTSSCFQLSDYRLDADARQVSLNHWLSLKRLDEVLTPNGRDWLQQRSDKVLAYEFRPLMHGESGALSPLHKRDTEIFLAISDRGDILAVWSALCDCDDTIEGSDAAFDSYFYEICLRSLEKGATHVLAFYTDGEPDGSLTLDLKQDFKPLPQFVEDSNMRILGPTPSLETKEERIAAFEVGHQLEWSTDAGANAWFIANHEHVHALDHPTLQWRIYSEPQQVTAIAENLQHEKPVSLTTMQERISAFDAGYQLQWFNEIGARYWLVATRQDVHTLDHRTVRWRIQPPSQEITSDA